MAKFDRFLLFSASLGCQSSPIQGNGRKLRKSIKGGKAKMRAENGKWKVKNDWQVTTVGPSWRHLKAGKESAEESRSKPPSILPAQNSVFKIGMVVYDRERKIVKLQMIPP